MNAQFAAGTQPASPATVTACVDHRSVERDLTLVPSPLRFGIAFRIELADEFLQFRVLSCV